MNKDGKEIKFNLFQESDGSLRLIDLLPAFIDLCSGESKKVIVIDELDRSLHFLLIKNLLENYLLNCSKDTRCQLFFSSHNLLLMDKELLRLDEIWLSSRDLDGVTSLKSFGDFKEVEKDENIMKSYLLGRLGGIPNVF